MNQRTVWKLLAMLVLLHTASTCAHALSRRQMPMGYYVRQAVLIVRGSSARTGERGMDTAVSVRQVLKGDGAKAGESLEFPIGRGSITHWILPREAPDIAVLIGPATKDDPRPVIEVYRTPEDLAALPKVIRAASLPTEREQLLALRAEATDPILRTQFLADARDMRERANLEILLGFAKSALGETRKNALEAIGFIGDVRGVPALAEALGSPDKSVAMMAAQQLRRYFPGAPGVDEAFEKHRNSPIVGEEATKYLQRLGPPPAPPAPRTLYQKISRALEEKRPDEARALLSPALADAESLESLASWHTEWLAREIQAQPDGGEAAWRALEPWLGRSVRAAYGDPASWQKPRAVKILSLLRRPEANALLQAAIRSSVGQYGSDEESQRTAAFALLDRGPQGRGLAVAALFQRPFWPTLQPLFEPQADEGAALIEALRAALAREVVDPASEWAIFRLGLLRERRAVPILAQWLEKRPGNSYGSLIAEALGRIASEENAAHEVEAAMLPLLNPPHEYQTRDVAQQVLVAAQGERALPLLRRALREDVGVKSSAARVLGGLGQAEDIALLAPLADFWSGDRDNHYWLQSSLADLRARYGHNIDGPAKARG